MKIKVLDKACKPLIENNGNFVDLRARETIEYKKGDFLLIPLGVCIALDTRTFGMLVPRSSTFKNYGLLQTNSVGIIDDTYCGDTDEWLLPVYCTRDGRVCKGDRVCQFAPMRTEPVLYEFVEHLGGVSRGGFGTTGK